MKQVFLLLLITLGVVSCSVEPEEYQAILSYELRDINGEPERIHRDTITVTITSNKSIILNDGAHILFEHFEFNKYTYLPDDIKYFKEDTPNGFVLRPNYSSPSVSNETLMFIVERL